MLFTMIKAARTGKRAMARPNQGKGCPNTKTETSNNGRLHVDEDYGREQM